jgi:hypothetical protein
MHRCPRGQRRSVDRGTYGRGMERRNKLSGVPTLLLERRATRSPALSRTGDRPRAVGDPLRVRNLSAREPGDPHSPALDGAAGRTGKAGGRKPVTHGRGNPDGPKVPAKSPNNATRWLRRRWREGVRPRGTPGRRCGHGCFLSCFVRPQMRGFASGLSRFSVPLLLTTPDRSALRLKLKCVCARWPLFRAARVQSPRVFPP